jgi:hypothetical protein
VSASGSERLHHARDRLVVCLDDTVRAVPEGDDLRNHHQRVGRVREDLIPQESGSGGTASWRVSDNEDGGKNIVQTLGEIVGENDWFSTTLTQFANAHAANKLPEDHHELLGMVAPRGLFVIENAQYQWLGVNSCVTDATAAQMIFQALGAKDNMAFEQHGHTHCTFDMADEWPALQAFIQKFLFNQSVSTQYWHVTTTQFGSTTQTLNTAMWINWTIPTLN